MSNMSQAIITQGRLAHALPSRRHAERGTLALYVLGDLSVSATASTREHLAHCEQCRSKLPGIRAVVAALRAA